MIQINQLKLPISHTEEELQKKIKKVLRLNQSFSYTIERRSLDARKKAEKKFVYCIHVTCPGEKKLLSKIKDKNITLIQPKSYRFPEHGSMPLEHRPIIVGAGPAGLFCGLMLAKEGYRPIILERGSSVEQRQCDVDAFWESGKLKLQSNVQFGEGGAGTFSDGKLNTLVKDPIGRNKEVLRLFVLAGANPHILYDQKPHLGTDTLMGIVKNIREEIISLGGDVRFQSQVDKILLKNNHICGVKLTDEEIIPTQVLVLATGHSARDTFTMLYESGIHMSAKAFAVGLRIQHPQQMIDFSQYGEVSDILGASPYKMTCQSSFGRGVYTFCMCPGGYVVNASSEDGRLAVNGMSYEDRKGVNANSAIITTVTPEDYPSDHPLAGMEFQRTLEEKAFQLGDGKIPVQLYGDFKENKESIGLGEVTAVFKGQWTFANLRGILPDSLNLSIIEAIDDFGRKIKGFDRKDALLAGVESRSSSPVRIHRNDLMESNMAGIYPCGEGAGYAGGITSAAMDGMKIAEAIAKKYRNFFG